MATSPSRRVRRIATLGAAGVVVAAGVGFVSLRNEPAKADYLTPGDAQRAVTRATIVGGSDRVVGVSLARTEAIVRVLRDGRVHSWAVRPGREAVETGSMAAPDLTPVRARDLPIAQLTERARATDVGAACKPRALKAEIAVSHLPAPITHVWCLDGAQHAWLGPRGENLGDVDPRTSDGLATAVADLRRFTGARQVSVLAIRYGGEDAGVDVEVPGSCGDLAGCDAAMASRRLHLDTKDPALGVRLTPARLNYAAMIDLDTVDLARVQATIKHLVETRKGLDWWGGLTVTLAQRPGDRPTLEFKQGSTVFWTDLDGADTHF